ncbi:hypothetical protein THO17_35300 [Marinomonas sp. THO17]
MTSILRCVCAIFDKPTGLKKVENFIRILVNDAILVHVKNRDNLLEGDIISRHLFNAS